MLNGSEVEGCSWVLGTAGNIDCIFSRNSLILCTPSTFHTVKLISPTPHQAYSDPQPKALKARDAPLSGKEAVAVAPLLNQ